MKLGDFFRRDVVDFAIGKDIESAIAEQWARIDRNPREAGAYCALGAFFRMQGRVEDAIPMLQHAIELEPNYVLPHRELGQIHAVRGNYEEAWRLAREAARLGDRSLLGLLERYQKTTGPLPGQ